MSPLEPGYVISGKYELVRLLGQGSMGEVWVAHHKTLGEDVAVKLLAAAFATGELEDYSTASARFRFEAQIAARLSRKTRHIVRVTDHGEEGALAYLVMELLEGRTLERRLMLSGYLPPAEVSRLVAQVARALECAHAEGVVHRDLKPANIFLARDEEGGLLVKLLDFGIARATRTQRTILPFSTGEGIVFGTPGYMSPEHACGSRLDGRADLWALATVAYEALTGELPLPGTYVEELQRNLLIGRLVPIHDRNPGLPEGLGEFFRRAFAPRIEHRFEGGTELALSFEKAISTAPGTHQRTTPMPASSGLPRGDTLPMAVDSPPDPKPVARQQPIPWARLTLVASAVVMLALGVTRASRTSVGGAPALATGAGSTHGVPSAVAPVPEASPSLANLAPSATEFASWPPDSLGKLQEGPPPRATPGLAPKRALQAAPAQTPQRPVPSSAVPAPAPSVAPARSRPIDKSATL